MNQSAQIKREKYQAWVQKMQKKGLKFNNPNFTMEVENVHYNEEQLKEIDHLIEKDHAENKTVDNGLGSWWFNEWEKMKSTPKTLKDLKLPSGCDRCGNKIQGAGALYAYCPVCKDVYCSLKCMNSMASKRLTDEKPFEVLCHICESDESD